LRGDRGENLFARVRVQVADERKRRRAVAFLGKIRKEIRSGKERSAVGIRNVWPQLRESVKGKGRGRPRIRGGLQTRLRLTMRGSLSTETAIDIGEIGRESIQRE